MLEGGKLEKGRRRCLNRGSSEVSAKEGVAVKDSKPRIARAPKCGEKCRPYAVGKSQLVEKKRWGVKVVRFPKSPCLLHQERGGESMD